VVEKKPKLLLHAGPPRSGTTYLYDLIEQSSDPEFRNSIQPAKGWKYIDHVHEQYMAGRIDATSYINQRMRFKENRLTQPNIMQIVERCLQLTEWQKLGNTVDESMHNKCLQIMYGFSKSFPKEADVHMTMAPHVANIEHLLTKSESYTKLLNKDSHLYTPEEICSITSQCISLAKETYVNVLNGFADSEIYESIDFVVNLRRPRTLFISNLQNQHYLNTVILDKFDMKSNFIPAVERKNIEKLGDFGKYILEHKDDFDPSAILYYVLKNRDHIEMDVFTARNINEFHLYNMSMMRVYEQFIGLAETFKDHPRIKIKFINEDVLNNSSQLAKILPYYVKESIEESPVYLKKTNSVIEGVFPKDLSRSILKEEDLKFNKDITSYHDPEFANKLINELLQESKPCCNFKHSNDFVNQQNQILDK
tara:strand:- start:5773 stop:7038 length:1266 start_codon:yes stop_codon:yes gene_type:complete